MHAAVMEQIGWHTARHAGSQLYYRSLGPMTIAKLQRPSSLDLAWLRSFRRAHHTLTTYIEPGLATVLPPKQLGLAVEPFAHSCTSLLDLTLSDSKLLDSFSQKTRYNIVRTLKKNELHLTSSELGKLSIPELTQFFALHQVWSKQKNVIGYSQQLLNATLSSYKDSGDLHLCYLGDTLVATLLTLYHDRVATYWAAFSLPSGYKSFAPTLLTWTAVQQAKARGCDIFDFGGIYDPRYPKMYKRWQGFTKFKEGFSPTVVSYPPTSLQLFW